MRDRILIDYDMGNERESTIAVSWWLYEGALTDVSESPSV
jgi:hypothetical protein